MKDQIVAEMNRYIRDLPFETEAQLDLFLSWDITSLVTKGSRYESRSQFLSRLIQTVAVPDGKFERMLILARSWILYLFADELFETSSAVCFILARMHRPLTSDF
jgi:hypothetical protein